MNPSDVTIIALLALIVVVDLLLLALNYPTISNKVRVYGRLWASFPYAWGVLGGHFWGPNNTSPIFVSDLTSAGVLLLSCALIGVFHRVIDEFADPPDWATLVYIPIGIPAGVFLWPQ